MSGRERVAPCRIILASASPRRRALLEQIGLPFEAMASCAAEEAEGLSEDPEEHVRQAAALKALEVAGRVADGLVVGADTIVYVDGAILGKPSDACEAAAMLQRLSGKTHTVYTGLAIVEAGRDASSPATRLSPAEAVAAVDAADVVATQVMMRALSESEIAGYVATGEPLDKAGAYAIQGRGAVLVRAVNGCYSNVVGLPVSRLAEMLAERGVRVL
jgi:septum formation protein